MYEFKTEPFDHQRAELKSSWNKTYHGLRWEMGTGKTKVIIDNAAALWELEKIDAVLVIAPNGVHTNWLSDELPAHLPDRIIRSSRTHAWSTGSANTKWHKQAVSALVNYPGLSWLFMSYNAIMTKLGNRYVRHHFLMKRDRIFMVLDESHHIKSPSAKRTIRTISLGKYADYRRILTGTMVTNGPFDIYSQVRFLDPDFWVKRDISSAAGFRQRYGEWLTAEEVKARDGYDPGYDQLLGYQNLDELEKVLAEVSTRVTKDDVLDLPPKLYTTRHCELTPEQSRIYKDLKEEFIAWISEFDYVEADLAITRLLRLQQVICGYVGTEENELVPIPGKNPRLEAALDWASAQEHQAIIWCRFTEDINLLMDALEGQAVRYDGKTKDPEASKKAFQRGEAKFFIGNSAKGAEGLTLVQAKGVLYYSNSFKLSDRLQSEDRAHRIGQKNAVLYTDLIAKGTIDHHIRSALRKKFDIATQLNGDKVKGWLT